MIDDKNMQVMLAFSMLSFAAITSIVSLMTLAAPRSDAIIGLVACWALAGPVGQLVDSLSDTSLVNLGKRYYMRYLDPIDAYIIDEFLRDCM